MLDSQGNYKNSSDLSKKVGAFCSFELQFQVTCEKELKAAIETATKEKSDCLCFIDVIVHKDDTSKELLEWGSRVCSANSRPPNAQ